ncbi:unnamed protein product [Strongylus vulgaris]|uniref:Uncharacterized protein n=1 Tax=Strongylus vulgaris TaxID=40348 RepID=A0A3P7IMR3_STRVU|nr:unnamed protein product [Strongylus vulgaris]
MFLKWIGEHVSRHRAARLQYGKFIKQSYKDYCGADADCAILAGMLAPICHKGGQLYEEVHLIEIKGHTQRTQLLLTMTTTLRRVLPDIRNFFNRDVESEAEDTTETEKTTSDSEEDDQLEQRAVLPEGQVGVGQAEQEVDYHERFFHLAIFGHEPIFEDTVVLGRCINHSAVHPNLDGEVVTRRNAHMKTMLLFRATFDIKVNRRLNVTLEQRN